MECAVAGGDEGWVAGGRGCPAGVLVGEVEAGAVVGAVAAGVAPVFVGEAGSGAGEAFVPGVEALPGGSDSFELVVGVGVGGGVGYWSKR